MSNADIKAGSSLKVSLMRVENFLWISSNSSTYCCGPWNQIIIITIARYLNAMYICIYMYMLWFDFFFGLFFLNQFKFFKPVSIFQTGLKFSNQIEIFKPVYFFFGHLSIKRENISLHSSILFSPILAEFLLIYYPPATLPLPPNSH